MAKRTLITTALESTWPNGNDPVLFLGEWCLLYSRKQCWQERDLVVAPYHWDDREKLRLDNDYLQELYEEVLQNLAEQLNEQHRVSRSLRYWQILVGPWLILFVEMLFDRWSMLKQVIEEDRVASVRVLHHQDGYLVPNDMLDFTEYFIGDAWNELIYGQILDWIGFPSEKIEVPYTKRINTATANAIGLKTRLKRRIADVASKISGFICRKNEFFFIASYLGLKQDLQLQARLGQFPKLWRLTSAPRASFNKNAREWKLKPFKDETEFAGLLQTFVPRHIPIAYLEGYRDLVKAAENVPWPQSPKAIFTSNSEHNDDVFKAWAAQKIESGVPLVIGQHGGFYGMAQWSSAERHELSIADKYLSWGWTSPHKKNIFPIGNLKGFGKKVQPNKGGGALLIQLCMPRQSYRMGSGPVAASQWQDYFDDQCRFVKALPPDLQGQLQVRLNPHDHECNQKQRWLDRFPGIKLDVGQKPLLSAVSESRLFISTYNSTTFLESLSLDFPTIIFWNPKHSELRESAQSYLGLLAEAGIFHAEPESAARHMAKIWHDVDAWWKDSKTQAARKVFCEQYARIPEKPLDELASMFRNLAH